MVPYYPLAPPGFFPHYAVAPGAFVPPPNGTPVTTIDPAEADGQTNGSAASGKKRGRPGKGGDAKTKKPKAVATAKESPTSGAPAVGSDQASDQGANSAAEND